MEPVCIIKDNEIIKSLIDELAEGDKSVNEQVSFLKKRAEALLEQLHKDGDKIWGKIEDYLEENDLVKDAAKKSLHVRDGVLLVGGEKSKCEHDDLPPPIRDLLDRLRGK